MRMVDIRGENFFSFHYRQKFLFSTSTAKADLGNYMHNRNKCFLAFRLETVFLVESLAKKNRSFSSLGGRNHLRLFLLYNYFTSKFTLSRFYCTYHLQ